MSALPTLLPAVPAAEPPLLDRVGAFLTEVAADLARETPTPGRGRPRILPAMALWGGLTVCILRGWQSQKALWRLLAGSGLRHFTPCPPPCRPPSARACRAVAHPLKEGSGQYLGSVRTAPLQ